MSEQKSKLFLAITLSIISVLLISAVSFTFPARAAIPLNVEFAVGEKMVYDTTRTTISDVYSATYNSSASSLQTEQTNQTDVDSRKEILEVIGFDGQSYTLNHTFTNSSQGMVDSSFLETISKVGQSTWHIKIGTDTFNASSPRYAFVPNVLEMLTSKPQARVGDSWRIPYESSGAEVSGDLIITFYGFENLTVPAGTYNVFKVGIKSDNVNAHYTTPHNGVEANIAEDFNIQIYLEYGSLRQIKYTGEGYISIDPSVKSQSYLKMMPEYTREEMVLVEHIKP